MPLRSKLLVILFALSCSVWAGDVDPDTKNHYRVADCNSPHGVQHTSTLAQPNTSPVNSIETTPEAFVTSSFLSPEAATTLFDSLLSQVHWDERMKARKTACFGQTYDDSGVDYQVVSMHPLLIPLCNAVQQQIGFPPTNCLLNYYETGRSTMGFHSDATYNLAEGTGVAIVSLGAERNLTFRSKADQNLLVHFSLPHGSLFYMTQLTQEYWTHAVKKTEMDDARISLTFRHILAPEELAKRPQTQLQS